MGCNFRGEEDESRPQNGLKFRLRESQRLESEDRFKLENFMSHLNSAEVVEVE